MKKLTCIILLGLFSISGFSQVELNSGKIKAKHYLDTIPYQSKNGKIFILVQIKGKSYKFLFDTGAPFAIYDYIHKDLDLNDTGEVSLYYINKKSKIKNTITLPKMKVGKITFLNTPGLILNKGDSKVFDCYEIDGIIGSNMLRNSVIQIDSKNKILIITDKKRKLSVKRKNSQKIRLSKRQSTPILKITLQKKPKVTDEMIFDSGADSFYTMSNKSYQFFKDNNIEAIHQISDTEGSSNFGFLGKNEKQKNRLLEINNFSIKGRTFKNIIPTINSNEHSSSNLGAKLLEYGKVTIDYNKKRFYFKPFKNKNNNELSQKPWPIEPTLKGNKIVIGLIWDKNLKKKINLGDEILKIGDTDYQSMDICEMTLKPEGYKSENKMKIELRDVKTGKIKELKLSRLK